MTVDWINSWFADSFRNYLDTHWQAVDDNGQIFAGRDRASGDLKWTASRVNLVFGSNSVRRAIAEV